MAHGNPEVCLLKSNGFILEVRLFSSSTKGNAGFSLLGESILISKPVARQLVKDLEVLPFRDVIVSLIGREYMARISISKVHDKYKIMDIEKTVLLGYINAAAMLDFAPKE